MNASNREHSEKWLNKSMQTVNEIIERGPPYEFSGPLSLCISMIESAPDLGIEVLKRMAETGDEKSLVRLGEIYLDGKISLRERVLTPKNAELGNTYLAKAAELGSTRAMLKLMGEHYIEDGDLKYRDPEKALYWLKRAADEGCETACAGWADHLVLDRTAQDCTQEEIEEIERYYLGAHYTSPMCYKLARFHSDGVPSMDHSEVSFERARYWLKRGADESRHNADREPCSELLSEWGIEMGDATDNEGDGTFILKVIAGVFGLVFWAVLGVFMAAAMSSIMAFTVPAIIIGFILYTLYKAFYTRGK